MSILSCPDCNGKVSDTAKACPHCGKPVNAGGVPVAPAASAPAAAAPPKSGVLDLNPKKNMKQIVVIFAVVGCLVIGWFVFKSVSRMGNQGPQSGGLGGLVGPRVLIDDQQQVIDSGFLGIPFRLQSRGSVTFELSVTQGDGVTAYIVDESEFEKIQKNPAGKFQHYEIFGATSKKHHRSIGNLGVGNYRVIVKEQSMPNLLGGPDTAMVKVKLSAE